MKDGVAMHGLRHWFAWLETKKSLVVPADSARLCHSAAAAAAAAAAAVEPCEQQSWPARLGHFDVVGFVNPSYLAVVIWVD